MKNPSLIELLQPYDSIALTGMSKNAGKTTTLNHLIRGFSAGGAVLGLTSIGLDGEQVDLVTGTPKPRIFVPQGSIIATAQGLATQRGGGICNITREILAVTDVATPLGPVVVMRALSAGFVQLAGPSVTTQIAALGQDLRGFGAQKIIVDGAVGRKSLAVPEIAQAAVLCVGAAAAKSMDAVIAQAVHIVGIFGLPAADLSAPHLRLSGAVTDARVEGNFDKLIVADDACKIMLSPATLEKMRIRGGSLAVARPIKLAAVTLNPTSPYGPGFAAAEFLAKMRRCLPAPVYDIGGDDYAGTFS